MENAELPVTEYALEDPVPVSNASFVGSTQNTWRQDGNYRFEMGYERQLATVSLLCGGLAAAAAVGIVASVFPTPTGNDVGGLDLTFLLVFPAAAFGGVTLGYGVSLISPRLSGRKALIAVELGCIAAILSVVLLYGRIVAPDYFEFAVAQSWIAATFVIGGILVSFQELIHATR